MFTIYRRGCRPVSSEAKLIRVILGPMTFVEWGFPGQPSSFFGSNCIEKVIEFETGAVWVNI